MSVSHDQGCLIGSGSSKTLVAVQSEKRVSSMGCEKGKPLSFRCPCHGHSPAHNRSISRNERPDTLDPCIKIVWSLQRQNPTSQFSVHMRSSGICGVYGQDAQ